MPTHKKPFANTPAGFAKLLRWIRILAPEAVGHSCLEATGTYSEALALFLAEADQQVSVVNPFRIKHAALAQGAGNKTDKADAKVIADYCRQYRPAFWRRSAPEVRVLVALLRRLSAVPTQRQQEANRLQEPALPKPVSHSLKQSVKFLKPPGGRDRSAYLGASFPQSGPGPFGKHSRHRRGERRLQD